VETSGNLLSAVLSSPVALSLRVSLIAVALVSLGGTLLARALARREFWGKPGLEALIILPMVLPPTVTGYGLLLLLGRRGPVGRVLDSLFGVQLVFSWWAAVVAAAVVSFPLMYQSAKAAFCSVDPDLEQAARTLGKSEASIFWHITLPLAYPGLLAGLVLSFARCLGEFGATLMVAGNIPGRTQTIPTAIYFAVESGDDASAQGLVLIITALSLGALFVASWWQRKRARPWQGRR